MEVREDRFFRGKIVILQPRRGYKFSLDAVLLSSWAILLPGEFAIALGGGFGPASIMAKFLNPQAKIISIDILEEYVRIFQRAIKLNGFTQIYPLLADVRKPPFNRQFSVIFSNPPYMSPYKYRVSPRRDIAVSKYEVEGKLKDFITTSYELLDPNGKAFFIVGAERDDFSTIANKTGFKIHETMEVLDDSEVKFRLYTLTKKDLGFKKYSFQMKYGGKYTDNMEKVLSGESIRTLIL